MTKDILDEDLAIDWTLSEKDIAFINEKTRGSENALLFAVNLCQLRNVGKFMQTFNSISTKIISYLTKQLCLQPVLFLTPPEGKTKTKYNQQICQYLGYRFFDGKVRDEIETWVKRILKKDFISKERLIERSKNYLKNQRIVYTSDQMILRHLSDAIEKSMNAIFKEITRRLSPENKQALDKLISPKGSESFSLNDYKAYPPEPTYTTMKTFIDRFKYLEEHKLDQLNLGGIGNEVIDDLSSLANCYNIKRLREIAPVEKRYALLSCFIYQASKILMDHIVDMGDSMLAKIMRESRSIYEKKLKEMRKTTKQGTRVINQFIVDFFSVENPESISVKNYYKRVDKEMVIEAVRKSIALSELEKKGLSKILDLRYPSLRKYTPDFFTLNLKAATGSESLMEGITLLRKLNTGEIKELPLTAPKGFLSKVWHPGLVFSGTNRRSWEMGLYYAVKSALQSGDLYIPNSQSHKGFFDIIYGDDQWKTLGSNVYDELKLPNSFDKVLEILSKEFEDNVGLAKNNLNKDSFAYIDSNGELKLRKDDALEIPESTHKLKQLIENDLPIIRIETLLEEVDHMTGFSKKFTPLEGYIPQSDYSLDMLYATIIAHGTNIGIHTMSNSAEEVNSYGLAEVSKWLIRQKCLERANACLVNYLDNFPITEILGSGFGSMSDGQRFRIDKSSNLSAFCTRYYGYYEKAISIYTHMSDRFSVFGTQVISCKVREATYVLTGLLNNSTSLKPTQHSTDTGGYTNQVFALCYLLGFSFQPRLKDLKKKKLYKLIKDRSYGDMDCLFKGSIDIQLIREQWDNIVRVAASLKNKVAPAHLIIQRLAAKSPTDKLAKALLELGRFITSTYILRYISDPELRREVQLRLCRCESRHFLAQHTFFFNQGIFRTNDYEQIMNKASCLSFLSNAVLVWNTHKYQGIIDRIRKDKIPAADEDIRGISPLMFKHVIMHGTYRFNSPQKIGACYG